VLDVYDPEIGLEERVKDAPCACTLQFFIRDDRLHLITYMRSNDVVWGLPYDVFLFTMLQELLSRELSRPLGTYTHIVGSLHLYDHHFELGREILRSETEREFEMPPMAAPGELPHFLEAEVRLRSGKTPPHDERELDPYWSSLLNVLESYRVFKQSASPQRALECVSVGSRYAILLESLWRNDAARSSA
jgi:thymidylate synthase